MQQTPKKLSRRDALKVLSAAAGATALANLPSKWTTPVLNAGVLPAHAQSSCSGYGLTFSANPGGAFVVLDGPPWDDMVADGINTWTWDPSHCTCVAFAFTAATDGTQWLLVSGQEASGALDTGATLYGGANLATGLPVHNTDLSAFMTAYENLGCEPFEIVD